MGGRGAPKMRTVAGGLVLACALAACSSWMPPAFSPALSSDAACTRFVGTAGQGPAPAAADQESALERQVRDVEAARRTYLHVARCLTQDSSLGTAGLLGLSSLALFKGVTAPHPKDMAGLGAVGGFAYLNSSGDAGARQRRDVYYRGADALGCALKAAEPYRLSAVDGRDDVDGLAEQALQARNGLLVPERSLRTEAARPALERIAGKPAAAGCERIARRRCEDPGSSASPGERAAYEACAVIERRCAAGPASTLSKTEHPSVKLLLADITKARDDIDRLLADANVLQGAIDVSARSLESQSALIQTAVARELDKTYPDPEAVLKSVGSLKAVAFNVTKAPAFGDSAPAATTGAAAAGQAHSDLAAARSVKELPQAEYTEAREALREALDAGARLRRGLQRVHQRVAAVSTELRSCGLAAAAAPAAPTAPAAPEAGAPTATASPPAVAVPSAVVDDLDGNVVRSLLGLPSSAGGGEVRARLQACQLKVLNQPGATGITLDADAMAALVKGQCKGVS